jgi:predicted nucleotide-binding protein
MPSPDPKRVFIVYGRNSRAHEALKLFLRALKLNPLDFDEVKNDLGG